MRGGGGRGLTVMNAYAFAIAMRAVQRLVEATSFSTLSSHMTLGLAGDWFGFGFFKNFGSFSVSKVTFSL